MAVAKIYNSQTGQWEAVIVGTTGDTGVVQSATEPSNTDQLWLDTDDTAEPLAIPAGGSAGQILQKSTDGDYDTAWSNVPSHNYIINGAFDIWQRGTSFSSSDYTADRWRVATAGGAYTGSYSQQSFSSGELEADGFGQPEYYYRATLTDPQSLSIWSLRQRIEDRATLSGQTATVSFWAKADTSRDIDVTLANDSTVNGVVTVTTSWARYSVTLNVPTATTVGTSFLELRLLFDIAAGATYDIWGVQLEAGSIATPFKRNANSIQGELAACQRYYERLTLSNDAYVANLYSNSSTQARGILFHTEKYREADYSVEDATDLRILRQGVGLVALTSMSFAGGSTKKAVQVIADVASGLTAGEGSLLKGSSTETYLEIDAEL